MRPSIRTLLALAVCASAVAAVVITAAAEDRTTDVPATDAATAPVTTVVSADQQDQLADDGESPPGEFLLGQPGAQRLAGPDRFSTAAAVAVASFPDGTDRVLLARGSAYADALSAAGLASALQAPILLTTDDTLAPAALGAINSLNASEVVLLGGTDAISPAVADALEAEDLAVARIAGPDRYSTAASIAERTAQEAEVGSLDGAAAAIVASGENYPDALAAGGLAYRAGLPILLSQSTALTSATASALETLDVERVLLLGGTGALSGAVESSLIELGFDVRRVGGATRLETTTMLADVSITSAGLEPRSVVLARGDDFPDALAAAPFAGETGSVTLLTQAPTDLGAATTRWLEERCDPNIQAATIVAVGSDAAVAPGVLGQAVAAASCLPPPSQEPTGPPAEAPQLLTEDQQSFSSSIDGWVPQGNVTFSLDADSGRDAAPSLAVLVDQTGPFPDSSRRARAGTTPGAGGVPVVPGGAYAGSAWVTAADAAADAVCELRWYDADEVILSTDAGAAVRVGTDGWSQTRCSSDAPPGAAYASLRVVLDGVDYGSAFNVDDASLVALDGESVPPTEPVPDPTDPEPTPTTPDPTAIPPPAGPANYPDGPGDTGIAAAGLDPEDLTPSGSITATSGQVIDGLLVNGAITVDEGAQDVVIRNTLIEGTGIYGIRSSSGVQNLLIENVTIRGISGANRSAAILARGQGTIRGVDVSGYPDGIKVFSDFVVEDSWIHDQVLIDDSHNDGIQSVGGTNVIIRNNRIEGRYQLQTSAVILQADNSPLSNYTLTGNFLSGGNYTLYIRAKDNQPNPTNMTVTNNVWNGVSDEQSTVEPRNSYRFGTCSFERGTGWTISGNTFIDGSPDPC